MVRSDEGAVLCSSLGTPPWAGERPHIDRAAKFRPPPHPLCSLNYECIIVNVQYRIKWTFFIACARVCAHLLFSRGRGGRQSAGQHRQGERRL